LSKASSRRSTAPEHSDRLRAFLEETKAQYDVLLPKIPGEERHQPDDFIRPLYEAIEVLKATTPLPALTLSRA
jgi:hypothetical protein